MRIHFHEPPPAQRLGGLDAAIRGMESALQQLGHDVLVNPSAAAPPDVAHFHGLWQPPFRAAARSYHRQNVPYIVSPHGMLEPWAWRHKRWKKLPYWHLVERPWVRRAACVLATAPSEARRLTEFLPKTFIEVLALGLTGEAAPAYNSARAKLGWASGELILLFLSRIHEKKGLDLLLGALAGIDALPSSCRLVIVGPEEQPEYAERCRRFAAENAARLPPLDWLGPLWGDDRWPYLQGADLFCLPTHSENFGLVVLESCQVGTPVLTTTTTPWADVLRGQGGFSPEPNVESIRKELQRFFAQGRASDAARQKVAEWARQAYAWSTLGPRYAALYERLATSSSRVEG